MVRTLSYKMTDLDTSGDIDYAEVGSKTSETYFDVHLGKGDEIADRSFNFAGNGTTLKSKSVMEYGTITTGSLNSGASGSSAKDTTSSDAVMVRTLSYTTWPSPSKKHEVARLEVAARDRDADVPLGARVVRKRDADLRVDVGDEARAVEAGGARAAPDVGSAEVPHRDARRRRCTRRRRDRRAVRRAARAPITVVLQRSLLLLRAPAARSRPRASGELPRALLRDEVRRSRP